MNWAFAATALKVAVDPPPARSGGYRNIMFEPPGYDGIYAVLPNGRLPTRISCTVLAKTYTEYETLTALFEAGTSGNLEIEHGTDYWVYANAYVEGEVVWEYAAPEAWTGQDDCLYRCRVTFVCTNPKPTWKTSGLDVF